MLVELFLADCKLCETMIEMMKTHFPDIDMVVHRASECVDGSCCLRAKDVGVRAVPTLAVDGRVVQVGVPTEVEIDRLKGILKGDVRQVN